MNVVIRHNIERCGEDGAKWRQPCESGAGARGSEARLSVARNVTRRRPSGVRGATPHLVTWTIVHSATAGRAQRRAPQDTPQIQQRRRRIRNTSIILRIRRRRIRRIRRRKWRVCRRRSNIREERKKRPKEERKRRGRTRRNLMGDLLVIRPGSLEALLRAPPPNPVTYTAVFVTLPRLLAWVSS